MLIRKFTIPTKEESEKFTGLITEAFMRNPMMAGYVYRYNRRSLRRLMGIYTKFYSGHADYYAAVDETTGEYLAVILWVPWGEPSLSLGTLMRRGLLGEFIYLILNQTPAATYRMLHSSGILEKYHYKEPHVYLEIVASVRKGCGAALLRETAGNYRDHDLYVASSVPKNDHGFYTMLGFSKMNEVYIGGVSNAMLVLKKPDRCPDHRVAHAVPLTADPV